MRAAWEGATKLVLTITPKLEVPGFALIVSMMASLAAASGDEDAVSSLLSTRLSLKLAGGADSGSGVGGGVADKPGSKATPRVMGCPAGASGAPRAVVYWRGGGGPGHAGGARLWPHGRAAGH